MKKSKKLIVFILVLAMLVSNFSFVEAADVKITTTSHGDNVSFPISALQGGTKLKIKIEAKDTTYSGQIGALCFDGWDWNQGSKLVINAKGDGKKDLNVEFNVSDILAEAGNATNVYINLWVRNNKDELQFVTKEVKVSVDGAGGGGQQPTKTPTPTPTQKPSGTGTKLFTFSNQNQYFAISYADLAQYETIEIILQKRQANGTTNGGEVGALCIGTESDEYNKYATVQPFVLTANANESNPTAVFKVSDILAKMNTNQSVFVNIFNFYQGTSEYTQKEVIGYGKGNAPTNPTPTPTNKPAGPTPTPTELWGGYIGNGRLLLNMIGKYEEIVITVEKESNISANQTVGGLCLSPDQDNWTVTSGFEARTSTTGKTQTFTFKVDDIMQAASSLDNDYALRVNIYEQNGKVVSVKGVGVRDYNGGGESGYTQIGTPILPIVDGGHLEDYTFTRSQLAMYSQIQVVMVPMHEGGSRPLGKEIGALFIGDSAASGTQLYSSGTYAYESRIFNVDDLLKAMDDKKVDTLLVNAYDEGIDSEDNDATSYITHEIRGILKPLEPDTIYVQTTPVEEDESGKRTYDIRFVKLITQEEADAGKYVEYTLTRKKGNQQQKAVLSGKSNSKYNRYYNEVRSIGETLIAQSGYVYLAIAVVNIPEEYSMSCDMKVFK